MKNTANRYTGLLLALLLLMTAACLVSCKKAEDGGIAGTGEKQSEDGQKEDKEETSKEEDTDADGSESSKKEAEEALAEAPDEPVDEEWIGVLKENGTFYDALYSLPKIMEEDPGNHPDNVKMPDGIIRDNLDYYIPQMNEDDGDDGLTAPGSMAEVAGTWIPITAKYQDIETDYTWIKDAGVDFHLILNEDGTGKCNMYGGEQDAPWNEKTILISGKDCSYGLDADGHLVAYFDPGLETNMSWVFASEAEYGEIADSMKPDQSGFLGKKLEDGKLYRLKGAYIGNEKLNEDSDDPQYTPEDHFIVMAETDEDTHNGYGYIREGAEDIALYYQSDRGIIKPINENTKDRSRLNGRWKFELSDDGKLLKLWKGYADMPQKYDEYELCEDEEAPISHLAVGPVPDRESIEVPEGTHKKAGFWHLDRIYDYQYNFEDPLKENSLKEGADYNAYGEDTRKYDADIWYVLREDGTGYMRVWNKYYEVVWNDDVQYYYDISGRHQMGTVVGEIDYDDNFIRLFKDELNEVPEYPEELK